MRDSCRTRDPRPSAKNKNEVTREKLDDLPEKKFNDGNYVNDN